MARMNFLQLPQWLQSNVFYRARLKQDSDKEWVPTPTTPVHPHDANLMSSENAHGTHYLVLDLDWDHWYHQSSTPGHGHLVIKRELEIDQLKEIINVLVKHGILQEGIKNQLDDRGCLTLRMPGMSKYKAEDNMSFEELKAIGKEPEPLEEKEAKSFFDTFFNAFDITAKSFDIKDKRKSV